MAARTAQMPANNASGAAAPSYPHDEVIPILDFGGQTVQLIARRVREAGAYGVLVHPNISADELRAMRPKGIVLSGGPASVNEQSAPRFDPAILELGVPVFGICYGMQELCRAMGSRVETSDEQEYGKAALDIGDSSGLLQAIPQRTSVWMSHADRVDSLPPGFEVLASTPSCPRAVVRHQERQIYGVQFHPEVTHTPHGVNIFQNFLYEICGCRGSWKMAEYSEVAQRRIREQVGSGRVICGLSGGVDSAVCASLVHKAIGEQLTCVFVDNGLLRKNERRLVETTFRDHFDIDLRVVDASGEFLSDLAGIADPQEKRRRIGHRFIEIFRSAAAAVDGAAFLAQGTLYPDVIESGHGHAGQSANIKLHHNVGGLPESLEFELVEPLRDLFKDEVRALGEVLGLPTQMVWRHPFPGPGLAVRVLGEVTEDRLEVLRDCDEILLEEIVSADLYRATSQVFAVLLPVQSVGVMGDGRTYDNVVAVRAVQSEDFMTADWARIPHEVLATISNRIINEVQGVNRVVYDISSKPPATIEWE